MKAKKPSRRKKKLGPITNLAADLEKQSQVESEKQRKFAPLGDLAGDIKRAASAQKSAEVRRAKKKEKKG